MATFDVEATLEAHRKKFKSTDVEKNVPLEFDLGNLTAFDINPIELKGKDAEEVEESLLEVSRDNTQLLLNSVFALPTASADVGVLAQLPQPSTPLPREKPVPVAKPLTRWEKFAKVKGIQKHKKSRLEFDDESGEYRPRYGAGSKKNDPMQDWAIEIPNRPGQDFNEDPREKKQNEKKERIQKQEKQRKRNLEEAASALGKTIATTTNGPYIKGSRNEERKKAIQKTLATAKLSTPGLGIHGTQLDGDKKIPLKRKRQFEPAVGGDNEREMVLKAAKKAASVEDGAILNVKKAVKRVKLDEDRANRNKKRRTK